MYCSMKTPLSSINSEIRLGRLGQTRRTLRFSISAANVNRFSVPLTLILVASSSGSLNLTVAAQWNTKFTFSINQRRCSGDRSNDDELSRSPSITLMRSAKSGFSARSRSNNWKSTGREFSNKITSETHVSPTASIYDFGAFFSWRASIVSNTRTTRLPGSQRSWSQFRRQILIIIKVRICMYSRIRREWW